MARPKSHRSGFLVRVRPPDAGPSHTMLYIVAADDPNQALKIVERAIIPDASVEMIGPISGELLDAVALRPGECVRA